ncbi:helix-turn-helix domain-containing protein [Streptomyces pactum]|uniref:AraC family transcriptional regulator n=1 Tax=Streptomyces pactum TaxID=68249 RepID=A0A1S6JIJ4_9ACTN|nr:AraC family transcriptional regulator [Streptomyces pactum]AQS65673.1 AraC family transcriptional regulator [Streptomyces pactum]AQS71583.1 AraC family transcriptional regulator [Streptomyces pactum]
MDAAVERAVEYIRERFGDPLTVADIAERARLGLFPFSRLFKEETGASPGRFLAAVRIHEAKRLIDRFSMSMAEISAAVGYGSLESFTESFTAGVGLPPAGFRRLCRGAGQAPPEPRPGPRPAAGAVAGTITLPEGHGNARVYLGAFATPLVQYPAVAAALVDVPGDRPSCYRLPGVPEGSWHLLAVAVAAGTGHDPHAGRSTLVGGHRAGAVTVNAATVTSAAVRLRPQRPADPPVLLALPELRPARTVVAHPGCAAAPGPRPAGRPRTVPAAPEPSGA